MSMLPLPWRPTVNHVYRTLRHVTGSERGVPFVDIASAPIRDIETSSEKTARTLKHLIKANHVNNALLYHDYIFHNHIPYSLGSAYLMGCDAAHLEKFYESEVRGVEPWKSSPSEVTERDWRDKIGNKRYYKAYIDFFEDELALNFAYEWKEVVNEYMFGGDKPLINGVVGGLGHPLIHLAYAYELNSHTIATEALSMSAISYSPLHAYLEDDVYIRPSSYSTQKPLEILHRIHQDPRLDGAVSDTGGDIVELIKQNEAIILEHWNAWDIEDPREQFRASQEAAVSLSAHSVPQTATEKHSYDFFLVHLLTTSHAARVMLPLIPRRFHISLLRQWFLFAIAVYIGQQRPKLHELGLGRPEKDWAYVRDRSINGPWAMDSHYVKALRAMKDAAELWGDDDGWYLGSAVKFADEFNGWTGWSSRR